MSVGNPDLIKKLKTLDKNPKKTVAELEEMKKTVAAIIDNDEELDRFLQVLKEEKWNPKTLELLTKGLLVCLNEDSLEKTSRAILAVLRANYKGAWSKGLVKGLSALLIRKNIQALKIFREILTKPRKPEEGGAWGYYQRNFMNYLQPNQGLPYILELYSDSFPEEAPPQIKLILKEILDRYTGDKALSFASETRAAFENYLNKRCNQIKQPLRDMENQLLRLAAMQRNPDWQEQLAQIADRLREAQATREVSWAIFLLKELAPQVHDQDAKAQDVRAGELLGAPEPAPKPVISPLETILAKKESFITELNSFIRKYEELQDNYSQTAQLHREKQEEIKHLKETLRQKDQIITSHSSSLTLLRQEKDDLARDGAELKTKVANLKNKMQEEQARCDVRVHQINIEAERKIIEFKDKLWRRLSPDLEDFLGGELKEDDYTTPERGRRLYRRITDLIRVLGDLEVIPALLRNQETKQ